MDTASKRFQRFTWKISPSSPSSTSIKAPFLLLNMTRCWHIRNPIHLKLLHQQSSIPITQLKFPVTIYATANMPNNSNIQVRERPLWLDLTWKGRIALLVIIVAMVVVIWFVGSAVFKAICKHNNNNWVCSTVGNGSSITSASNPTQAQTTPTTISKLAKPRD